MARYSLILKDETYMRIYQKAATEGLSFGKYVNNLLNDHVMNEVKTPLKVCFKCGGVPIREEFWKTHSLLVCRIHKSRDCKSWRDLAKIAVQK